MEVNKKIVWGRVHIPILRGKVPTFAFPAKPAQGLSKEVSPLGYFREFTVLGGTHFANSFVTAVSLNLYI